MALVFATTAHGPAFGRVARTVAEVLGTRDVVGCSAAGVLAGEDEVEDGAGVAVLALGGDFGVRRFFIPVSRGQSESAADELAALAAATDAARLLVLFADTYNVHPESLLAALSDRIPGVRVVGGGASEDGSVGEVSVFSGDTSSSHAIAGVILSGDLRCTVGVAQALRRIGPVRRITAADRNWIVGLDGQPALEAFRALVPETLLADPRRALGTVLVGLSVGDGESVARHLVGLDVDRGAVGIAATVRVGQEIFFGVRDPG
ncbi:MAG TPA: FIST N-terminal domain-containing protein, partial [Candidatus Binatia bacterium]|nr:FIST N-terminal domain-containing protein [Candidatus Binatia bacterium]